VCGGLVSHYRGGRVRRCVYFIRNIRNIRNIIIKSITYFCLLWNFFWNIRNIIVEHYKNKGFDLLHICCDAKLLGELASTCSDSLLYFGPGIHHVHTHTTTSTHVVSLTRRAARRTGVDV
jgi:hypothetical protein